MGMQMNLIISLEEFPGEGRFLSGELDAAVFGIDCDALRSTGPLSYELEADNLILLAWKTTPRVNATYTHLSLVDINIGVTILLEAL